MTTDEKSQHAMEAPATSGPSIALLTQGIEEAAGIPVLFHLATPSLPLPYVSMPAGLRELVLPGIRPITYFRSGYAGTQGRPGRKVADAAVEAVAVLDQWGVEKAVMWGGSGGGPHALACGALIPERVAGIVLDSSSAPFDLLGERAFDGMNAVNRAGYAVSTSSDGDLVEQMRAVFDTTVAIDDPDGVIALARTAIEVEGLPGGTSPQFFADLLAENGRGWADDVYALTHPWGFDLQEVTVPVHVMFGTRDTMTPPTHGRFLAANLANATVDEYDGDHVALGTWTKGADVIAAIHRLGKELA